MLPSPHRMVRSGDFASAVRRGRRVKTPTVVIHHLGADGTRDAARDDTLLPARVGFVVSKAVGGSVVRNRVARRLRAQVVPHLSSLPHGSDTVVRALPAAAGATSARLGDDVTVALSRLRGPRP